MRYLLSHALRDSAQLHPERTAVIDGDRSLTYAELDARSSQLANLLRRLDVRRGDRVALYLDKSLESVIAVHAVLKTGAAYVPIDPQAPVARAAYILGNCGVQCLLSGAEKQKSWAELAKDADALRTVVALNARVGDLDPIEAELSCVGLEALEAESVVAPPETAISMDLAYILYTSGSTGQPKGVMLTHDNALAFVEWAAEEFRVTHDDRLSSHAPLHFDLSIFDLYVAALTGAVVILVPTRASLFPQELGRFLDEAQITVWYSVPSILSMLVTRGGLEVGRFPSLRTILFAGEVFPTKYLRQLMALLPHVRFANLYGPTETNVCTWYEVPQLPEDMTEAIPIGRAIRNDEVFAVKEDGTRAAPGEQGELLVRGRTVMRGYWADPERTARGLVPNPLPGLPDLVYRTGDIVVEGDDGVYRFVGRRDAQIKSRGYRIELGEIESALYAHPAVDECAVIAVPDELVTNRIKAYVALREEVSEADLNRFLGDRIPRYMVPEALLFRDKLPKTSTGKVDRQALKAEALA